MYRGICRRFEKASESLVGLTEGISLWKSVSQSTLEDPAMQDFKEHEMSGKRDTIKRNAVIFW